MDLGARTLEHGSSPAQGGETMGDKSPKAKDKAKKQNTSDKNQKKAVASAKVQAQGAAGAAKKGR
jgi:hypothetical protein